MMKCTPACLFVGFSLSIGTAHSNAQWYYYYDGQQEPLTLAPEQVAVQQTSQSGGAAPDLSALGIGATDVNPWAIAGWYLVDVPLAYRSSGGVQSLVDQLTTQPGVAFSSPVFVDSLGGPLIITRELLVRFDPGVDQQTAEAILSEFTGTIVDVDWGNMPGAYRVRTSAVSGLKVLATANALAERQDVKFSEPDVIFTGLGAFTPNDPGFPNCWGIHNKGQTGGTPDADMDGPEAWDLSTGDPSIIVVIIDTGVQQDHPDINQIPGMDVTSDSSTTGGPVNPFDRHGTPVAGYVSAIIDNALGTVGIAPNCPSASARTFIAIDSQGRWTTQTSWTVDTLAWAEAIGARVTNNSNWYAFQSNAIADKYAQTRDQGMVHFSSANNDGIPFITYPASLPSVNALAALDHNGDLAAFSNFGSGLAFSAPGESIYTTDQTGADGYFPGDYGFVSGTSAASAYAAGVAALVLSVAPFLDAEGVEIRMQTTAIDLGDPGYDEMFGWGFVNAFAAIEFDCNDNGIADELDIANGTSTDCNGNKIPDDCEVDSDDDGLIDACDDCPFDPDKIAPGACGCGVSDVDSDGDTVPDCFDICPGGNDLVDTDGDGQPDFCDPCALDNKNDGPEDSDGDTVCNADDLCDGEDDLVDADSNSIPDCLEKIPTVSEWGLVVMTLLLLVGGKVYFHRRAAA